MAIESDISFLELVARGQCILPVKNRKSCINATDHPRRREIKDERERKSRAQRRFEGMGESGDRRFLSEESGGSLLMASATLKRILEKERKKKKTPAGAAEEEQDDGDKKSAIRAKL
ncbi:unnamed protein product [Thlaspi arvense]|uniref:Uncharacterized protein n=1 Tax=Thlaspi arvense TaxID=13288 RepID=A0AAU9SLC0_THLAR|nr:unnamed protein product [Thlaspi arvense]